VVVYSSVFVLIVAIISIGYRQPLDKSAGTSSTNVNSLSAATNQTSVDSTVAASVAASVAKTTNLSVATSVANLSISTQLTSEISQSDTITSTKPQIILATEDNRLVTSYTTVAGDTVDSLAAKFGISAQTIRWANNLTTSSAVNPGTTLKILPFNGVLYSVKSDDTIASIAKKYQVDQTRLVIKNDLDVSGLQPNTSIILPEGTLPEEERPGYVAPVVYTQSYGTGFGGNTWFISYGTPDNGLYAHGNCTLYTYNRRRALGLTVGDHWGNASSWAYMAALPTSQGGGGLLVDHTPSVGAIIQNGGYLGHVGVVEAILANGDISISEMNAYVSGGGYNIVSGRIVLAGNVSQYSYIH